MFLPGAAILDSYAHLLVAYGLNNGLGAKPGDAIWLTIPDCASPLRDAVYTACLAVGAHPVVSSRAPELEEILATNGSKKQMQWWNRAKRSGQILDIEHRVHIEARDASPPVEDTRNMSEKLFTETELSSKHTYTIGLFGTPSMATAAGMTISEYWEQIIAACYLRNSDPVYQWKRIESELQETQSKLDSLAIESVHISAPGTELTIGIGPQRKWLRSTAHNIPSFEVHVAPDWRTVDGTMQFSEPLNYDGTRIEGIALTFCDGVVIKSSAEQGHTKLQELLSIPGANRLGEFSMTDGLLSPIDRFMDHALYDENRGGRRESGVFKPTGNTHAALGFCYEESYTGAKPFTEVQTALGFNQSTVHVDIVSTTDRIITAQRVNGKSIVIYENGQFTV